VTLCFGGSTATLASQLVASLWPVSGSGMSARRTTRSGRTLPSPRVGGLPGLYWPDVAVPIGERAGEPGLPAVEAVSDAVEIVTPLTVRELEELRRRLATETDEITVCERMRS
jgi:hypothetical protein